MALSEIRKLGDPILHIKTEFVSETEVKGLMPVFEDMWRLVAEFREYYGHGRAIAAPQVGLLKRVICINTDKKYVLINPEITWTSDEYMVLWDDCMSFPNLRVKVKRHKALDITFRNIEWEEETWRLENDMAELIQHEYDHLDGILATDRAIDKRSFKWVD